MSFFHDVFNNIFALIFGLVGVGLIFLSVFSCSFGGIFGSETSSWVSFIIFFLGGIVCLAIARAFSKRG